MNLRSFTLKEKTIFEQYLKKQLRNLSVYSFENTFCWRPFFELQWAVINEKFCLFFKNKTGCFMNFPPLGGLDEETVRRCFKIMEDVNYNKDISRIENIEEDELDFFEKFKFKVYEKSKEYIVSKKDIVSLKGEKFKHKRSLYNFFIKNYDVVFRDYNSEDKKDVLELYRSWMQGRMLKNSDSIYQAMLLDSFCVLSELLKHNAFKFLAKVVEYKGKIIAFSSGFEIRKGLFCINFEFVDLSFKGLPQFIFTEFAKTLTQYPEINIMDDSGIENLKKTKLSYKPVRTVVSYTALLS